MGVQVPPFARLAEAGFPFGGLRQTFTAKPIFAVVFLQRLDSPSGD